MRENISSEENIPHVTEKENRVMGKAERKTIIKE